MLNGSTLITVGQSVQLRTRMPLICFEWHQRPENVLAGHMTWLDIGPADHPLQVRIVHHKTGEHVWLPVSDEEDPLFL